MLNNTSDNEKNNSVKTDIGEKNISRRKALMAGLLGVGVAAAKVSEAAEASCACLAAPDCDSICPNGGTPRGDGTQACVCNAKASEQLADVAYTGSYNDLTNRPLHAGSDTDGGDARNSVLWKGHGLRLNHNTTDTWIPVFSGNYVDYVLKSELGAGKIGATTLHGNSTLGNDNYNRRYTSETHVAVTRDDYGRPTAVGYWTHYKQCDCNCNCDCCNCGDDSN